MKNSKVLVAMIYVDAAQVLNTKNVVSNLN